MEMTKHARCRAQQRAIPPLMIDLLLQFGSRQPAGSGASRVYFDKTARRRLASHAGPLLRWLDDYTDIYVIVGDGDCVITTAHLTERIRRN